MVPQSEETKFEKFESILTKISDNVDSGKVGYTEIYEKIKNQLREELNIVYEEWESSKFDPNFRFKLDDDGGVDGGWEVRETTLLNVAIGCRREAACVPLVRCLLDQKANPNTKDSYGYTPLSEAVSTKWDKNKEVVELLLKKGADPNIVVGFKKETPLYIACQTPGCESFNIEIIELLLKNGADVNQVVDDRKNTVLHILVSDSFGISDETPNLKKQLPGLIELLIKCGANIYAQNSGGRTPESDIENRLRTYSVRDKEFVTSIQELLKKQKNSTEYHKKLFEVVERNKDLRSLADIIAKDGPISIMGIQVCSKVIPQILRVPGIKLAVKGTIVEGEVEQEFSQGTGWPVIEIEGNSLRYYGLFDKIISLFRENSVIESLPHSKSETLSYRISRYIRKNTETIKQELWGEPRVSSTSTETTEVEGNITTQHVTQKEHGKGTVKQHVKEKTKGNASKENRNEIKDTSYTDNKPMVTGSSTFNSGVYSQKEPPIFSRKQKIAIAVGIVAALATALVCYSVELPVLAIAISALIAGVGAYMVSSKLYDVSICNGTNQQPGF